MAERILKAVEFEKCSAKFKKQYGGVDELWHRGWALQPKHDGCYGMAVIRGGGQSQMLSRTGEDYTASCQHILDEIEEAADDQDGNGWDPFIVLGEVWHPDLSFPTISGKFRKKAPSELQFIAHDLLPVGLETTAPYSMRLTCLMAMLPEIPDGQCYVKAIETIPYQDDQTPLMHANRLKALGGYDGAILKDLTAGYSIGLASNGQIVKVKPVLSLDLELLRIASGIGGKTGRIVYTLVVEYNGVTSFVGSGVPHILTFEVGDIIEVECMGITDDGKLREPRFKGVRYDKTVSD